MKDNYNYNYSKLIILNSDTPKIRRSQTNKDDDLDVDDSEDKHIAAASSVVEAAANAPAAPVVGMGHESLWDMHGMRQIGQTERLQLLQQRKVSTLLHTVAARVPGKPTERSCRSLRFCRRLAPAHEVHNQGRWRSYAAPPVQIVRRFDTLEFDLHSCCAFRLTPRG